MPSPDLSNPRRPMHILMVTRETAGERRYGIGRSLGPLTDELKRRGIAVDYICQSDLGHRATRVMLSAYRYLSTTRLRGAGRTDWPILLYILIERINMGRLAAKLVAQWKATHVHCHDPLIAAGFRFFALFRRSARTARWGVTEHGFGCYVNAIHADGIRIGPTMLQLLRRWEAAILRSADWVVAPTHSALRRIAEDVALDALPVHWHAIHHPRAVISRLTRAEARARLNWDSARLHVLAIGRIAPVKQFPMLIEACGRTSHAESLQLVILGEGDTQALSALGRQAGLRHDILFATTDDVGLYLSAADVYVSASASESFGLANFEALDAGVASICTAVGGVPEVVGDAALLIPPDRDALTEGLQRLLDDAAQRLALAAKARARALAWPSLTEIADRYEALYR